MTLPRRVGLVGLGSMGLGMAQSLRRNGFDVHVYDRLHETALAFAADGGVACGSISEMAADCDVVVSAVGDAAQTEDILFGSSGAAGGFKPGSLFVMCSTVSPERSQSWEERLSELNLLYLDAPMSGGAELAASGQMTLITSGRHEAYDRGNDVLEALASKIYRVGERAGAASLVKLLNQLLVCVHLAAACEATALAFRKGVEPNAFYEVISHSAGNSWIFENRIPPVLRGDFSPTATVDLLIKDIGLVLDAAKQANLQLPLTTTAQQMYQQASAAGFGQEASAAVIKTFEGIELPGAI